MTARCHWCSQLIHTVRMQGTQGVVPVVPGHDGSGSILARWVGGGNYVDGRADYSGTTWGYTRLLPHAEVCSKETAA